MKKLKSSKLDMFIKEVIKQDTQKIKLLKETITKSNYLNSSNKLENTNPYIFSGLVESIFHNNSDNSKQNIYGCGILIDSDIILVSSNNLVLQLDDNESCFSLSEINFYLFNVLSEYQDYLPYKINVKDYYTPLSTDDKLTQEERLLNAWGIILIDYPIGEFLKFILEERMLNNKFYLSKKSVQVQYPNLGIIKDIDLENTDLEFFQFECDEKKENDSNLGIKSLFEFKANSYPFITDENFFILINNNQNNVIFEGPIVYKNNFGKYIITGINSNFEYKDNDEESRKIFALRITNSIMQIINESSNTLKNKYEAFSFNKNVFRHLTLKISNVKKYQYYLKDNCKFLEEELFNEIKEKNDFFKYKDEADIVSIYHPFIKFSFFLISNKIFKNYDNIIDLNNFNFGINGCEILSEIMKNLDGIKVLNLRSNNIYSDGLKTILTPVLNTPQISKLCNCLVLLNIDNNKLGAKGTKYLSYFLKFCCSLESLSINNNNIMSKGMKYLQFSLKSSENLRVLSLNYNNIDSHGCDYLGLIIKEHKVIKELSLESNCICDEGASTLFKTLKTNTYIKQLSISYNSLTSKSDSVIGNYLSTNNNLVSLNLSNNNFSDSIEAIASALSRNSSLKELNLNSTSLSNEGIEIFCDKMMSNETLRRIYMNSNEITDENIVHIVKLLRESGVITHLFISNNYITNEGAKLIAQELGKNKYLSHLKLNSNYISDEGGDLLLLAIFNSSSIRKFNIENNFTSWRDNKIDIKNLKEDLEILY